jgi:hypothetical protein
MSTPKAPAKKKPYPGRKKRDRNTAIYGLCVRKNGHEHYAFNRDYKKIPVELPTVAVEAIISTAAGIRDRGTNCHWTEIPEWLVNFEDWKTYYVVSEKTEPNWIFPE